MHNSTRSGFIHQKHKGDNNTQNLTGSGFIRGRYKQRRFKRTQGCHMGLTVLAANCRSIKNKTGSITTLLSSQSKQESGKLGFVRLW